MSTHVLNFLFDVYSASSLSSFKSKMLQKVSNSVICIVFISASCIDKYTNRTCLSVSSLQRISTKVIYLLEKEHVLRLEEL